MKAQHLILAVLPLYTSACTSEEAVELSSRDFAGRFDQSMYVSLPAAGISMAQPEGFTQAENFYGVIQEESGAAVMAVKLPTPVEKMIAGFTPQALATKGLSLAGSSRVEIAGMEGRLFSATQQAYGMEFSKWLGLFGDASETKMITASFPQDREDEFSELLKAIVMTVQLDTAPAPEPGSDIDFKIADSALLKPVEGGFSVGKALMLSRVGMELPVAANEPIFVAAPSLTAIPEVDPEEYSLARVRQTEATRIQEVTSHEAITIGEDEGFETIAEGEDAKTGTALLIYQVMLFRGGEYFLIQGMVGLEQRADYLPEFKRLARSLEW